MRRVLARSALVLGSLALVALVCEGVARLLWVAPERGVYREREKGTDDLPVIKGFFNIAKPNVRGIYKGAVYETNSAAFRGPETAEWPEPDGFRIAVIGDSVAMGAGVAREQAYPALLEARLNQGGGERRFEVLNLGLSGLHIRSIVNRFRWYGERFHPDLAIYGYTLNDIEGPAYEHAISRAHQPIEPGRRSPSYLWRWMAPRLVSLRDLVSPAPGTYVRELNDNYFENPEAREWLEAGFDALAAAADELGVCVHVLIHPKLYMLHFLHPLKGQYELVAEIARERGMTAHVALPGLLGHRGKSLWVHPFDSHPGPRGHELLAAELERSLEAIPPECWEK